MNHLSEDRLLEYVLETLAGDDDRSEIVAHLTECPGCRTVLDRIQKDIAVIGGIRPSRTALRRPQLRRDRSVVYTILRAAAIFIFGVLVGIGYSEWIDREPVHVSSAYVTLSPPDIKTEGQAVSDATEVSASCYENISRVP